MKINHKRLYHLTNKRKRAMAAGNAAKVARIQKKIDACKKGTQGAM